MIGVICIIKYLFDFATHIQPLRARPIKIYLFPSLSCVFLFVRLDLFLTLSFPSSSHTLEFNFRFNQHESNERHIINGHI